MENKIINNLKEENEKLKEENKKLKKENEKLNNLYYNILKSKDNADEYIKEYFLYVVDKKIKEKNKNLYFNILQSKNNADKDMKEYFYKLYVVDERYKNYYNNYKFQEIYYKNDKYSKEIKNILKNINFLDIIDEITFYSNKNIINYYMSYEMEHSWYCEDLNDAFNELEILNHFKELNDYLDKKYEELQHKYYINKNINYFIKSYIKDFKYSTDFLKKRYNDDNFLNKFLNNVKFNKIINNVNYLNIIDKEILYNNNNYINKFLNNFKDDCFDVKQLYNAFDEIHLLENWKELINFLDDKKYIRKRIYIEVDKDDNNYNEDKKEDYNINNYKENYIINKYNNKKNDNEEDDFNNIDYADEINEEDDFNNNDYADEINEEDEEDE